MARFDMRSAAPDPLSIWVCPCGWRSEYKRILGHRKGWKNRPECAKGNIRPYLEPDEPEAVVAPPEPAPAYDFAPPQAAEIDSEEIARQLRRERARPALPPTVDEPTWEIDTPPHAVRSSISTVTIRLAARQLVMYDYMKGRGWFVDDGSVSAWVDDMLNTLFVHVLGISVAVMPLDEVKIDG